MKNKDLIDGAMASISSLIKVVKAEIEFHSIKPERMKGVLEGRHLAFTVARSQINILRDLEHSDSTFDEDKHKARLKRLVDSTSILMPQIKHALKMTINLKEIVTDDDGEEEERSNDEKFKSIVMSKKVALDFLIEIKSARDSMAFSLENESFSAGAKKNLVTSRIKRHGEK